MYNYVQSPPCTHTCTYRSNTLTGEDGDTIRHSEMSLLSLSAIYHVVYIHPDLVSSIPFCAILICSSNLVYFLSLRQWPNHSAMGQGSGLLEGESAERMRSSVSTVL